MKRIDMIKALGWLGVTGWLLAASGPQAQSVDGRGQDAQISQFVRRIFEDRRGNMWFGTNGDGVIRYDGSSLQGFSVREGFGGSAVRGIVEDADGNVWFGTEGGLTKYDGTTFTNYTTQDGLAHDDVWCLAFDRAGTLWVGTLMGVSRFDGETFAAFKLPATAPDPNRGVSSAWIVHSIMQDSQDRMWFGTGGGAYIWDGKTLTNVSTADGLCSNSVNDIVEDRAGRFWFATHYNGVCRLDGTAFTHITTEKDGVEGTEVWSLCRDLAGNIWFPTEGFGVYRYDGKSFRNFFRQDGLSSPAIQCAYEDRAGRIWCGGYMGLYRFDGSSFVNLTNQLPWP